jgi:hypothetical protein
MVRAREVICERGAGKMNIIVSEKRDGKRVYRIVGSKSPQREVATDEPQTA